MKKLLLLFLFLNIQQAMASDIIFKDTAGRMLSHKDLKGYSGKATWEIPSDKSVSRTAVREGGTQQPLS